MPKFGTTDPDAEPEVVKPAMDQIPAATKGAAASIPTNYTATTTFTSGPATPVQQLSPEAQLAKIELEKKQQEFENEKQSEHWVKAYWRPAMGWLYMLICLMDFVVFPAIAMFLPVILKGFGLQLQYVPWVSLSLSNGGLIHMAFGAILGVAAYGRTQEKVASKQ